MKVFTTLEPKTRHSLIFLFIAGLLFWSSIASLLPTLPLYVEHVGGKKQEIGLVMGAFAIGLLASRTSLGPLADKRGRKIVLIIGPVVTAVAPLGYLFVQSIPLLMLIRAFHGISIAAFTTGYNALITDLSPPQQRGELVGYMSLAQPIGVAIGPALGGFLQEQAGYPPLFLMAVTLGCFSFFCALPIGEPTAAETQKSGPLSENAPPEQSLWQMLNHPRVRIPTVVMLLIGIVFGTITTFVPLFIKQTAVSLNAGLFYSTAAISSFSMRLATGRASDRYGRALFITGSLVAYTLAMLLLSNSHTVNSFLLAALLEGSASGTLIPMMVVLMSDRCLPQERGRLFSLCIGGFDFGLALAGPILGTIAEYIGYRNIFAIGAGLAFFALILFITRSSKSLSHSLRFALGREKDFYALENKL